MQYVGADADINNVVFSVMSSTGKVKETFILPSTPDGMDKLVEKMSDVGK